MRSSAGRWVLLGVAVMAASVYTIYKGGRRNERAPAWVDNRLVVDTVAPSPRAEARLLWLSGRVASPTPRGSVALDEGGGIVEFDHRLRPTRRSTAIGLRELASVASAPAGGLWLSDTRGNLVRVDSTGRPVWSDRRAPFAYPALASDAVGRWTWLSRSPQQFGYEWDAKAPLLVRIDDVGSDAQRLGLARLPAHTMLQDLANAGRAAVAPDGRLFFAPFIRDEVLALSPKGDTLWTATRSLPQSTIEPRFEIEDGKVVINYHPVNLGIALGPEGNVYVLTTPGFTTEFARLDVFDAVTGRLLRTADLPTALPTLAVDASGRVYALDATRLLTGVADADRPAFPKLSFETLEKGTFDVTGERGRVLLVNVWASWCAPCREEMPALDSLRRAITDTSFRFVTINVDATRSAAERFMREFGFTFPVAFAGHNAASTLQYVGLPHTLLIDRDGRVAQRWSGYAGPQQISVVGAAVHRELSRATTVQHAHH